MIDTPRTALSKFCIAPHISAAYMTCVVSMLLPAACAKRIVTSVFKLLRWAICNSNGSNCNFQVSHNEANGLNLKTARVLTSLLCVAPGGEVAVYDSGLVCSLLAYARFFFAGQIKTRLCRRKGYS